LPAWLRARGGGTLIFGAVGVLAVLFVGYTVWDRLSSSAADPPPRRASTASPSSGSGQASAPAREVSLWSATPGEKAVPNQPRRNWRRPAHAMKKRSPNGPTIRKR
jgi:hypothetical protein